MEFNDNTKKLLKEDHLKVNPAQDISTQVLPIQEFITLQVCRISPEDKKHQYSVVITIKPDQVITPTLIKQQLQSQIQQQQQEIAHFQFNDPQTINNKDQETLLESSKSLTQSLKILQHLNHDGCFIVKLIPDNICDAMSEIEKFLEQLCDTHNKNTETDGQLCRRLESLAELIDNNRHVFNYRSLTKINLQEALLVFYTIFRKKIPSSHAQLKAKHILINMISDPDYNPRQLFSLMSKQENILQHAALYGDLDIFHALLKRLRELPYEQQKTVLNYHNDERSKQPLGSLYADNNFKYEERVTNENRAYLLSQNDFGQRYKQHHVKFFANFPPVFIAVINQHEQLLDELLTRFPKLIDKQTEFLFWYESRGWGNTSISQYNKIPGDKRAMSCATDTNYFDVLLAGKMPLDLSWVANTLFSAVEKFEADKNGVLRINERVEATPEKFGPLLRVLAKHKLFTERANHYYLTISGLYNEKADKPLNTSKTVSDKGLKLSSSSMLTLSPSSGLFERQDEKFVTIPIYEHQAHHLPDELKTLLNCFRYIVDTEIFTQDKFDSKQVLGFTAFIQNLLETINSKVSYYTFLADEIDNLSKLQLVKNSLISKLCVQLNKSGYFIQLFKHSEDNQSFFKGLVKDEYNLVDLKNISKRLRTLDNSEMKEFIPDGIVKENTKPDETKKDSKSNNNNNNVDDFKKSQQDLQDFTLI